MSPMPEQSKLVEDQRLEELRRANAPMSRLLAARVIAYMRERVEGDEDVSMDANSGAILLGHLDELARRLKQAERINDAADLIAKCPACRSALLGPKGFNAHLTHLDAALSEQPPDRNSGHSPEEVVEQPTSEAGS